DSYAFPPHKPGNPHLQRVARLDLTSPCDVDHRWHVPRILKSSQPKLYRAIMKYLDEYRDGRIARALADEIAQVCAHPWVLMEICGGQTHTIMRYGLDDLLPKGIELVHGPGCP